MCLAENYDDVCKNKDDEKATHMLQEKFKAMAQRYLQTKADADKLIKNIKTHEPSRSETVEEELKILVTNFETYYELMKSHPEFCDRLLDELNRSIDYFVNTYLTNHSATSLY